MCELEPSSWTEIPASTLPAGDDAGVAALGTLPLNCERHVCQAHSDASRTRLVSWTTLASDFRKTPGPYHSWRRGLHDLGEISGYPSGAALYKSAVVVEEMSQVGHPHLLSLCDTARLTQCPRTQRDAADALRRPQRDGVPAAPEAIHAWL